MLNRLNRTINIYAVIDKIHQGGYRIRIIIKAVMQVDCITLADIKLGKLINSYIFVRRHQPAGINISRNSSTTGTCFGHAAVRPGKICR